MSAILLGNTNTPRAGVISNFQVINYKTSPLFRKTIIWNVGIFDCNQHYTVSNSVVGIIGCGNIGMEVMKRLQAFSPKKVLYFSRKPKSEGKIPV